jgi:hypothetical protein
MSPIPITRESETIHQTITTKMRKGPNLQMKNVGSSVDREVLVDPHVVQQVVLHLVVEVVLLARAEALLREDVLVAEVVLQEVVHQQNVEVTADLEADHHHDVAPIKTNSLINAIVHHIPVK